MPFRLALLCSALLTPACGGKTEAPEAAAPTGKAVLLAGSWRCETDAPSMLAADIGNPVHTYDATYLPDGDVRISGTVTGTLGLKPVSMAYMARAKWALEKDTLTLDYSVQAATNLTVEDEPLDHSMLNKDFIDIVTNDPSFNSVKLTVTDLTDKTLVLTDVKSARTSCKRAGA